MEEQERIVNGYCRTWNQNRMVICECWTDEEGTHWETDCDYPNCVHSGSCEVMKRAVDLEQ
ncbi:hypothetical protein [Hominifimenecus sp. rT4P-3]|uniref:hypothetical protein n=1 Tax=Hominifimenecus sp. rT4P-3 TaxID=3242979 RepID=UPI003DA34F48